MPGKLIFKGDSKPVKKLKKRKHEDGEEISDQMMPPSSSSSSASSSSAGREQDQEQEIEILSGTGRFTSSGTTVQGHGTSFMSQLSNGDAIIITHPTSLAEETKIVRMVLSDVSIGISSAFSSDLISTTPFRYIKAPKDEEAEKEQEQLKTQKKHRGEEEAFGTYASKGGEQIVYREKKKGSAYGGYKVVTIQNKGGGAMSREDLLEMRAKKKSDRFCY